MPLRVSPRLPRVHSHKRLGGGKRISRAEVGLLFACGVFALFTLSAFFHIFDSLPTHGIASQDKVLKIFEPKDDWADTGTGAIFDDGEGDWDGEDEATNRASGSKTGAKRRRRHKGLERDCLRKVFSFYTNLTSSANVDLTYPATPVRTARGNRATAAARSALISPTFETWITHGDSRYSHQVNLEVDANNRSVIYAARQSSNAHEGAKDQEIQLAKSENRGRRWKLLPTRIKTSRLKSGGFVPVWNPVLHSCRNGELLLFYSQSRPKCRVKGRSDWYTPGGDVYFVTSKDNGVTFGDPKVAMTMRKAPLALTSNLVTLKEGKREVWIIPVFADSRTSCANSAHKIYSGPGVIYTKNFGMTWNFSQSLMVSRDFSPGDEGMGEDGGNGGGSSFGTEALCARTAAGAARSSSSTGPTQGGCSPGGLTTLARTGPRPRRSTCPILTPR